MERDFTEHIGYHIQEIARGLTRIHNEMLNIHGISFAQFRVLNCLWEQDGMNQSEIAEMLHIKPSSLSTLVTLLEKKKLIIRVVDAVDTRSRKIFLTNIGSKLKTASWEIMQALEGVLAEPFSMAEKALLLDWLQRMETAITDKEQGLKNEVIPYQENR